MNAQLLNFCEFCDSTDCYNMHPDFRTITVISKDEKLVQEYRQYWQPIIDSSDGYEIDKQNRSGFTSFINISFFAFYDEYVIPQINNFKNLKYCGNWGVILELK